MWSWSLENEALAHYWLLRLSKLCKSVTQQGVTSQSTLTFSNRAVRTLYFSAQSYRPPTVSEAHQLGVAGGDNSTALTTLLADTVHSCSRHGVVAAALTSERPGSVMSLSQTFTPLGVYSKYQWLSKFLKRTEVRCCVPNAPPLPTNLPVHRHPPPSNNTNHIEFLRIIKTVKVIRDLKT